MVKKTTGWVLVRVLNIYREHQNKAIKVLFKVSECEYEDSETQKFPELIGNTIFHNVSKVLPMCSIQKGFGHRLDFIPLNRNADFIIGHEYVLLIRCQGSKKNILKVAECKELCKIYDRPYFEPDEVVYLANILLLNSSVRGTLSQIYKKLERFGEYEKYLNDEGTDWYIVTGNDELRETIKPRFA